MAMRLQIPSNASVEFFSLRAAPYEPSVYRTGTEPKANQYHSEAELTPVSDPIARLTRECSALRLRLATAERRERQSLHGLSSPSASSSATLSAASPPKKATRLAFEPSPFVQAIINPRLRTTSALAHNSEVESVASTRSRPPRNPRRPESRASTIRSSDTVRPSRPSRPQIKVIPPEPISEVVPKRRGPAREGMKPAERCKQLEKTLREVQELLRVRDREIEVLKKERDRLLTEREQDRNLEKEREATRERERAEEREKDRARQREREREKEREKERERERERERQRERERERERTQQRDRSPERADPERKSSRRFDTTQRPLSTVTDINILDRNASTSSNAAVRRSRSQAPLKEFRHALGPESEQLAQLRSLDVFLTKTDTWSGAQVIQAVEDLNSEITHFAASAVESCVFEPRTPVGTNVKGNRKGRGKRNRNSMALDGRSTPTKQGPNQEVLDTVPWLGQAFARILATRDHAQDPTLVQLALQASLATCCARSLSLFCVGFPSKLDGLLSRVFAHMQITGVVTFVTLIKPAPTTNDRSPVSLPEPQPTSSRWRSLSHRTIRTLYPGLEEYAISELVTTMLRWSAAIFTLSGCPTAGPNSHNATKDPMLGSSTLRAQLRRIAEAVYKLAKVTREEILSTCFEIILVDAGKPFEQRSMVNAFTDQHTNRQVNGANGKGGREEQGSVLCTTELGLRCVTRKGKASSDDEDLKTEELFDRRVLLPPRVMLDTAADAFT